MAKKSTTTTTTTAKTAQKFWDSEKAIGKAIAKADGKSALKVKLVTKTGNDGVQFTAVDVRKFVNQKGKTSGFGQHTMHGLTFEDAAQLHELIATLQKAERELAKANATA